MVACLFLKPQDNGHVPNRLCCKNKQSEKDQTSKIISQRSKKCVLISKIFKNRVKGDFNQNDMDHLPVGTIQSKSEHQSEELRHSFWTITYKEVLASSCAIVRSGVRCYKTMMQSANDEVLSVRILLSVQDEINNNGENYTCTCVRAAYFHPIYLMFSKNY